MNEPVAILFFSHVFNDTAIAHLRKLKAESVDFGTFFVYADVHGHDPGPSSNDAVRFDFQTIRKEYPRIFGDGLLPGNCHLTLLNFFKRYPDFRYYWVIEYDVMFTGHWRDFFSAFADCEADFLACHIRRHEEEPEWYFWKTLQAPEHKCLPAGLIRAFCPIQRVSRRSLELLETRAKEGWVGHFEGLVPTLLADHGHTLADFGGDGDFVPKGLRNRFYKSFSWRDGRIRYFGSMRFRPPFVSLLGARRNTLYHPVKNRYPSLRALADLEPKAELFYLTRNLRRHPVGFCHALWHFFLSQRET